MSVTLVSRILADSATRPLIGWLVAGLLAFVTLWKGQVK
jgi:hypothetical protein